MALLKRSIEHLRQKEQRWRLRRKPYYCNGIRRYPPSIPEHSVLKTNRQLRRRFFRTIFAVFVSQISGYMI